MAFDGTIIADLVHEFKEALGGGRIPKIAQPEKDGLLIAIKSNRENYRLQISVSVSPPLTYLADKSKLSPMTTPNFCMPLREHISSARVVDISQLSLEHIIQFGLKHLDETGDLCHKKLIVEIMGKHSNVIFCEEDGTIIDSIKHALAQISSVREVLPERTHSIPQTVAKENPLLAAEEAFRQTVGFSSTSIQKALYNHPTDASPVMVEEICHLTGISSNYGTSESSETELLYLHHVFSLAMEDVKEGRFTPIIVSDEEGPVEYATLPLICHGGSIYRSQSFRSINHLLEECYASRDTLTRIRQKSPDLCRIVQTTLEHSNRKHDLQLKRLKDVEKREKHRIYGKLLNIYGYEFTGGERPPTYFNYYINEEITILLDTQLSVKDGAKKRFDKYNKLKCTYKALTDLTKETEAEINHLESVSFALDTALVEDDLMQVKGGLMGYGYIKKRRSSDRKSKIANKPLHYISSDDFHVYVGKNNYQSEEPTLKLATRNDWRFHAKGIPGSHIIVKTGGRANLPDHLFGEAGSLAAYHSRGCDDDEVEIDYIREKNIKKVAGATPGFTIYHTNYSLVVSPECRLNEVERFGFTAS